ncbi:hypothetical protein XaplCFBP3122_12075 [Xanthomonas arboricola pv. populi]|uniref:Uncharacterized protein n=1 Tax=Xanthomonas arboricola pv. populi TaxID=487823 RepID=A0A2S6Z451_9XANT|nr:hypothetical protein C1H21_12655 [Xanthomonas arboricola pv. juglandis]PPT75721.1 hypothetical protein XaplCFBP3122_12075 [Xanthomonas arboricola pv. populi]
MPHRHRESAVALLKAMHTDPLDWSLPAHRRETFGGMDAAKACRPEQGQNVQDSVSSTSRGSP